MLTAVAYARFSSDNQHAESIEAQLRAINDYAQKNKINIVKVYTDEAKSGTTDDRPEFLRMISELKTIRPDFVLTHKMDRFSRNRYDSAIYKKEIKNIGAKYIAVDQILGDTPEAIIIESLLEGMAEYYSANLSREVSTKMKEYARKNQFLGGIPPLGYDVVDKQYVINEFEAETVKIIYRMRIAGFEYGAIAKELAAQNRLTKKGRPFGKNSLHEILKNEKYTGTYVYNKAPRQVKGKKNSRKPYPEDQIIKLPGAIPQIVSREDWLTVQSQFSANKRNARKVEDSPYILTGVMRCGHCGGSMTGHTLSKDNAAGVRYTYRYYRCSRAFRGAGECDHRTRYTAPELEEEVLTAIEEKATNIKNVKDFTEKMWEKIQITNNGQSQEKIELKKQLATVELKIKNYQNSIANGIDPRLIAEPMNAAGRLKEDIENRLLARQSPFEKITKKQVRQFLEEQQGIAINRQDIEMCKKIVTDHVKSVTVWDKDQKETILKYRLGSMPDAGSGGAYLFQAYQNVSRHKY